MTELNALRVADPPEAWRALGFDVGDEGRLVLGGVTITLDPGSGRTITGWSLPEIDGLPHIDRPSAPPDPVEHPNRATGLDHVVVITPDFDRTAEAFAAADLEFRRVRDLPDGIRQGFRRCGPAIVEVVEVPQLDPGPAKFWGLVPIVADLDALHAQLGPDLVSEPKRAVQPGRQIVTVRRGAKLTCAMAFMTPEPN
jgi:hypothetical protein